MILIADCGSTKIDWCLLDNKTVAQRLCTQGINAVMLSEEEIRARLAAELTGRLGDNAGRISAVYFYGAGCIAPSVCDSVCRAISANLPSAKTIEVYSDLMAAARSLCGHEAGIAAIMGTGSNSCLYDGKNITDNVSPLGFILGDEGSGAVIGKLFIGDVLKRQLPEDICTEFLDEYKLDLLDIIQRVYREPQPNRFLASVLPFLAKHIDRQEIYDIIYGSFRAFFRRNIVQYKDYQNKNVNIIGSVAYYFRDILTAAANAEGCHIGQIVKSPMDGLVAFHSDIA